MNGERIGPGEDDHEEVSEDAPTLSEDRLYRALASRQRRRLLVALLEQRDASIDELATLLIGWDVTDGDGMATPADYSETKTELVHNHLPHLDDSGFVDYDPERGTVRIEPLHPDVTDLIRRSVKTHPSDLS